MTLSQRMLKIVNFVETGTKILDVGTDHGYIPIYLVENGISKNVIASDISKKSLEKTIRKVKHKKLEEYIDVRLGDGLNVIEPNEVDGVIMAGMGGILIEEILEKSKDITDTIDYLIFQPMIGSKELRQYLNKNSFKIVDEELAKDKDKFYEIIYAKRGKGDLKDNIGFELSKKLIEKKHPLLGSFLEYKIKKYSKILEGLKYKASYKSKKRYNELEFLISQYREVLREIETK